MRRHRDKTVVALPGKKSCLLTVGLNEARRGGTRAKDIHGEKQREGRVGADMHKWEEKMEKKKKLGGKEGGQRLASKRKVMAAGKKTTKRNKTTKVADFPAPSTSVFASSPTSKVVASPLLHKEGEYSGMAIDCNHLPLFS